MKSVFVCIGAALLGLALSACEGHTNHDGEMHHSEMVKGIEISAAYVQPPFPGRDVAAAFFEIENHGEADRLLAVTSPLSDAVEIHTHLNENGVMKMRKIDGVDLPKGEAISFKPGSYHIMLFGAAIPEGQTDAALTFTYEKADAVTLIVPIGSPDEAKGDHTENHSGH